MGRNFHQTAGHKGGQEALSSGRAVSLRCVFPGAQQPLGLLPSPPRAWLVAVSFPEVSSRASHPWHSACRGLPAWAVGSVEALSQKNTGRVGSPEVSPSFQVTAALTPELRALSTRVVILPHPLARSCPAGRTCCWPTLARSTQPRGKVWQNPEGVRNLLSFSPAPGLICHEFVSQAVDYT